jgi:hypothetical protein
MIILIMRARRPRRAKTSPNASGAPAWGTGLHSVPRRKPPLGVWGWTERGRVTESSISLTRPSADAIRFRSAFLAARSKLHDVVRFSERGERGSARPAPAAPLILTGYDAPRRPRPVATLATAIQDRDLGNLAQGLSRTVRRSLNGRVVCGPFHAPSHWSRRNSLNRCSRAKERRSSGKSSGAATRSRGTPPSRTQHRVLAARSPG